MDTHRLSYFLRVAEEGSINRAAGVLGVAQPALSRQVRLLEEDLGVQLFRRTARGVRLTQEGERLRAAVAGPLRRLELAVRYAGSPLARIERGLHVGMPETAAVTLALPLLGALGAAFPRVTFQVSAAPTENLVAWLLDGSLDIALLDPVQDGRLFQEDLVVEDLVVVGGRDCGLSADTAVSFAELCAWPLVLPASRAGVRTALENVALRLKMRLSSHLSTDSLDLMKEAVAAGHGFAVLPYSSCVREIASHRLCHASLFDPALTRPLRVSVTSRLDLPRGLATRVGGIIKEETARLIESGAWRARLTSPVWTH
ncbi:LysR family transcriptional regulator [Streptomyces sp. NPDC048278]|uniref:LysR family transcriptional regulator n=1 Tax=Streptomyces sp. NPDC048278 TaxID=3155809 RepID=UPI003431440C